MILSKRASREISGTAVEAVEAIDTVEASVTTGGGVAGAGVGVGVAAAVLAEAFLAEVLALAFVALAAEAVFGFEFLVEGMV